MQSLTGNNLTLSAQGNIGQTGAVSLAGSARLSVQANGEIMLNQQGNRLSGLSMTSLGGKVANIAVSSESYVILNTLDLTGNLSVNSASNITDSGKLTVAGNTIVNAKGSVALGDESAVETTSLTVVANSASIMHEGDLDLAKIDTHNFTLLNKGSITNSGEVVVSKAASFKATVADIELGVNAAAKFGSVSLKGNNVKVVELDATRLNKVEVADHFNLQSNGNIIQSDSISANLTTLKSINGGLINLSKQSK